MTKITPPSLVPSAEERLKETLNRHGWLGPKPAVVPIISELINTVADESFRAGIDAVIALLREPDETAVARVVISSKYSGRAVLQIMAAFADLLEARRG